MSTITSCTSRLSVRANRSKSSIVSAKTESWKTALPDTEGRKILFKAERAPSICDSALGKSLPGRVIKDSITMPNKTKKNAAGSSL